MFRDKDRYDEDILCKLKRLRKEVEQEIEGIVGTGRSLWASKQDIEEEIQRIKEVEEAEIRDMEEASSVLKKHYCILVKVFTIGLIQVVSLIMAIVSLVEGSYIYSIIFFAIFGLAPYLNKQLLINAFNVLIQEELEELRRQQLEQIKNETEEEAWERRRWIANRNISREKKQR